MIKIEDLERFQKAEKEVLELLRDDQVIDIVSGSSYLNLYLNKSGEWYAGFDLMGYSIGRNPDLAVLLKEYLYALTGNKYKTMDNFESTSSLHFLIYALDETAVRLRKSQVSIEMPEKKIKPIRILVCKECKSQIDEVGCIYTCKYDNGSMNRNPETLEYWVYEFARVEAYPSK